MNSKPKVLIVEDEHDIRELLALHMERGGFVVDEAANGDEAIRKIIVDRYDLLILDWMLPEVSGLDVLKQLREAQSSLPMAEQTPVLMLTAKTTTSDIVLGLESGADDYVTKPFEPVVLLARARTLLRRTKSSAVASEGRTTSGGRIEFGSLSVDPDSYEVSLKGESLSLTLSEFKLLYALITNRGRVLTRDQLIELVQGEGVAVVDRAIDTHVFGLRKKLGDCAGFVETVRGVGYRINLEC